MAELKLVGLGLRAYGDIIFNTDGAYDIGKAGATRPRHIFFTGTITGGAASFTTGAFSGKISANSGDGVQITNSGNLTWGGVYGATIPTIAATAGAGISIYPTGSSSGKIGEFTATSFIVGASTFVVTAATGEFSSASGGIFKGGISAHQTSAFVVVQDSATMSMIRCYGPDATTVGTFSIHLMASDGSPDVNALSLTATQATIGLPLAITGALTGVTTLAASGTITITNAAPIFQGISGAGGTSKVYLTDGTQAASWALSGGVAYLQTESNVSLVIRTNSTPAITIDNAQAVTLASSLAITGALSVTGAATTQAVGVLSIGGTQQTTVGAAGGASALPATPTGYIKTYIGSTQFVIPYYAQA